MNHSTSLQFEISLKEIIAGGIQILYDTKIDPDSIEFQETKKEFDGDVTLVVFPFTRFSKKTPEATAADIGEFVAASAFPLKSFNVVKGFLNLVISESYWIDFFTKLISDPEILCR